MVDRLSGQASLTVLFVALAGGSARAQVKPPGPAGCAPQAYQGALAEGRWTDALAEAEGCYKAADRGQDVLSVYNSVYYRAAAAQLLAFPGRFDAAESLLRQATDAAYAQGLMVPGGMIPVADTLLLTEAFIHERRGATVEARERYARNTLRWARGRQALMALGAGQDHEARLQARLGDLEEDPTGQYVLGALAELQGDTALAWFYYHRASSTAKAIKKGSPTLPVAYAERERIQRALTRVPVGEPARVMAKGGLKSYREPGGRRIAEERWPGVLATEAAQERQRQYNSWISGKRGLDPELLAVGAQYPRRFVSDPPPGPAGFAPLRVPAHIEPTGVLDLDTLAVGYYRSAVEWAELCAAARVTRAMLSPPSPPEGGSGSPPAERSQASRWLLEQARGDLLRTRAFLSGIVMHTAAGDRFDAVEEAARRDRSDQELRRRLGNASRDPYAGLPGDLLESPPDFVTAHVRAELFTEAFQEHLLLYERTVRGRLFLVRSLLENPD